MNTKTFDALIRVNRDHHTDRLKEAQTVRLLNSRNSVPWKNQGLTWTLMAILFITILAAHVG